ENAAVGRGRPVRRDSAARKRDQRPAPDFSRGQMRRTPSRSRSRRQGFGTGEYLHMNPSRAHAPGAKPCRQIVHELRRPAEIEVGISRNAEPFQDAYREMSSFIEVRPKLIRDVGTAVQDVATSRRERFEETSRLHREWMALPISRPI